MLSPGTQCSEDPFCWTWDQEGNVESHSAHWCFQKHGFEHNIHFGLNLFTRPTRQSATDHMEVFHKWASPLQRKWIFSYSNTVNGLAGGWGQEQWVAPPFSTEGAMKFSEHCVQYKWGILGQESSWPVKLHQLPWAPKNLITPTDTLASKRNSRMGNKGKLWQWDLKKMAVAGWEKF